MSVIEILIALSIFMVLQSLAINGIYECFKGSRHIADNGTVTYNGMVFYKIAPKFFEKYRHRWWSKPLWSCIKCMASVYGALTYWPMVIWLFGFHPMEIAVYIVDVFILVYLNAFFYNKL